MKMKPTNPSGSACNGFSSKAAIFFLFILFLFALDDRVSAALPSNEVWREDLINNVIGFGRNTTGGAGGMLCRVTNLNNSGTGSLRACAEATGPQWIVFDVSGTITTSSEILVKSNKTIDGRGQDITIANRGLIIGHWGAGGVSDNVIVHNIKINSITGNGAIIIGEDASHVWIDHVTFGPAVPSDETLYVGSGSQGYSGAAPHSITISWNRFWGLGEESDPEKMMLISDPALPQDTAITITAHHNHYDHGYIRHPLGRHAKYHSFNNYYNQVVSGIHAGHKFQVLSENDIFHKRGGGETALVRAGIAAEVPFAVKVTNPWLINSATVQQLNTGAIFNPLSYYPYTADTANPALQANIVNNAGWQDVNGPVSPVAPTNLTVQ